jgi:hypothetical protein
MLGFSLLQLVTFEPEVIGIPKAQHSTASVYLASTKYISTFDHH